jgi:hypothetical protein
MLRFGDLQKPMTAADAEQFLATVFRPLMPVQSSPALFAEAFRLWNRFGTSWFNSLIFAGALDGQCKVLDSEDFQSGQRFGELEIKNPFAQELANRAVSSTMGTQALVLSFERSSRNCRGADGRFMRACS